MNIFDQLSPHQWEYFAGYYLSSFGYTILEQPSVGQDQGKDLMVELGGLKYLVSCKHFSRSQRPVLAGDERSVLDRLVQHDAQKFIGFYSTSGSNSLREYLEENNIEYLILEGQAIFDSMADVSFSVHQSLFRKVKSIKPKIFGEAYRPLLCKCGCGNDLLSIENSENSSVYLTSAEDGVGVVWQINGHVYDRGRSVSSFTTINDCFSLVGLNRLIDEHELVLDIKTETSPEFDEEYNAFLEIVHQMIYPMD